MTTAQRTNVIELLRRAAADEQRRLIEAILYGEMEI